METKNDIEKHPVGKEDVERGTQDKPADGSSADSRRECTESTEVGSIPPPDNENNGNGPISTTDMPDKDSKRNNTASAVDGADSSSLIVDSPKNDSRSDKQELVSVATSTTTSNAVSAVKLLSPPAVPGDAKATFDQSWKSLNVVTGPLTDGTLNQLSPSQRTVETTITTNPEVATKQPPSSTMADALNPSVLQQTIDHSRPKFGANEQNQTLESQQTTNPVPSGPPDESTALEDAVRALRAPLVDRYAPFIEPCDTSLADARARLRTALEQTRQLRAAFSDRVYEKYRVCLRPPPSTNDILNAIYADPVGVSKRLQEESRRLYEEKEIEKKEAQELNAQWAAANINSPAATANSDAEQFMYITAGLSLVILPEQDVEDIDMSGFQDRAPIDTETGQRIRSISVAAAAAGESIIDRARKGQAMIQERRRRHSIQYLSGEEPHDFQSRNSIPQHASYSTLGAESVAVPPFPTVAPTKPALKAAPAKIAPTIIPQSAAAVPTTAATTQAKSNRSRAPPTMSANNLLSISPTSEELRPSAKISAATAALIAKGVGCQSPLKSPQQKSKHPHPDSLGGRRQSQSLKNYAAYLSISLPLIPSSKERRDAKALAIVDSKIAGSQRAVRAIQEVVTQFVCESSTADANEHVNSSCASENRAHRRKRRLTEIGLLQGIQRIGEHRAAAVDQDSTIGQIPKPPEDQAEKSIDPILAYCVLQAVGLVRKPRKSSNLDLTSRLDPTQLFKSASVLNSDGDFPFVQRLSSISRRIWTRKRSFSDAFLSSQDVTEIIVDENSVGDHHCIPSTPRISASSRGSEVMDVELIPECVASPSAKSVDSCPVESIRGGGDVLLDSPGDGSAKDELQNAISDKPANERQVSANDFNQDAAVEAADASSHSSLPGHVDAIAIPLPSGSSSLTSFANQGVVWEEHAPQAIAFMNSRMPLSEEIYASVAANSGAMQQRSGGFFGPQPGSDHLHHRPAASALQLAHQLRHATVSLAGLAPQGHQSGASDLSEYIGSLHATQARAYDWSSFGAAAMAASMGLTPHHSALAVPDQARLLLSREQQTAVSQAQAAAAHRHTVAVRGASSVGTFPPHLLFNGVPTHNFSAQPPSRFAHLGAQSAASAAAFLTSSTGSRMIGRTETTAPPPATALRSETPCEQQQGQSAPSRSRKGSVQSEGSSEDIPGEDVRTKDSKKQNNTTETYNMARKRKTADEKSSSSENPSEQHDTGKRRKVVGSDECLGDNNGVNTSLSKEATDPLNGSNAAASGAVAPCPTVDVVPPKAEVVIPSSSEDEKLPNKNLRTEQPDIQALPPPQRNAMQFELPPIPDALPRNVAELVRCGRFHEAMELISGRQEDMLISLRIALIEYLVSVGANIPIPKTLVFNPLKDRLNTPVFKNSGTNGTHPVLREVIAATILVYLWSQHEVSFQRAFAASGRIDVDPCCKWLIQAAIDASTRALTIEIADAAARGGPMALALAGHSKASAGENEAITPASARLDVLIASTISKSLMTEIEIDETMDFATQAFEGLVEYLDDCRMCALRCKSRERALLAAIISRRSTMSESFSHAYVSAMVRAGFALGQADLFESVQNDATMTSTMIPFDIIEDENGLWEDPCRPIDNISRLLTGDDLMKRAHARAMIQKSLKKLQDRHHLKGGVARSGPYADPVGTDGSTPPGVASKGGSGTGPPSHYQRGWSKRRTSSFSEPPVPPGTGSAEATSKSLYDPRHFSAPLIWLVDEVENTPYGRQNPGVRPLSIALTPNFFRGNDLKRPPKEKNTQLAPVGPDEADSGLRRSTCEIDWADVAGIFQQVTLPGYSPGKREADEEPKPSERDPKSIIAPFCRKIEILPDENDDDNDDDEESAGEEDLSDDEILKRHQVVLDRMKQRLNTFFETRKKAQQRRKTNKTRA